MLIAHHDHAYCPRCAPPRNGPAEPATLGAPKRGRFTLLEQRYAEWIGCMQNAELDFKRFVYENQNLGETDFRQHRQLLYGFLAMGEEIAVDFLMLEGVAEERVLPYIALADQKLNSLRGVLHAWHGPIEEQKDLPASFKKGVRDLAEGRIVPMEVALREAPQPRTAAG